MVLLLLFIFGLFVGSFLNVLVDRLPKEEGVIWGRSYCDYCKHVLSGWDLVPLLSFCLLRRRCRYCRKKISLQYPLSEISTASLFAFTYTYLVNLGLKSPEFWLSLAFYLTVVSALFVIFLTDLKSRIIPDQMLVLLLVSTLVYQLVHNSWVLPGLLSAGLVFFGFFLFLFLLTKGKGMGFGDVKYAFIMGFLLGWPKIIVAFYLAFLTGACISVILVLSKKKSVKSTLAFGPFLVWATFMCLFYGDYLWEIFKRIVGI